MSGQIVVITGAAGGIGKELCRQYSQQGAVVWAADVNAVALEDLKQEARKQGWEVFSFLCNVTKLEEVTRLRDEVLRTSKRIDVWVNNAGVSGLGDFMQLGQADFDRVMKVNLDGVVLGTRVALETMEARGTGTIVNMASVAGHVPAPYFTAYNASKHAVIGFTRALRAELALKLSPVKLILVSPGFVDTPILRNEGRELCFPERFRWALAKPENVARSIILAVKKNRAEIYPTLNGKVMIGMRKVLPEFTVRASRLFLANSLADFVFNRMNAALTSGKKRV